MSMGKLGGFDALIKSISQGELYLEAIKVAKQKYNICGTNIDFLTPNKVLQTYSIIRKKFYYVRKNPANCSWFENELRIYIWVLICYLFVREKDIIQMTQEDWMFFKPIFYNRQPILFEFQGILLLKNKNSKWTDQEIKMLEKIVRIKTMKNKWNAIARQLYVLSGKEFVKTPKQCRERWLNYLDPSKVHSPWTSHEDLVLLTSIRDNGKKWAFTVKKLLKKRTEHMVKNRYNSLMNNEKKRIGDKKTQSQLMTAAIETCENQIGVSLERKKPTKASIEVKIEHIELEEGPTVYCKRSESLHKKQIKRTYRKRQNQLKHQDEYDEVKLQTRQTTTAATATPLNHHNQSGPLEEALNLRAMIFESETKPSSLSLSTFPSAEKNSLSMEEGFEGMEEEGSMEMSMSIVGFNPFEEATPNHEFLVPGFFFHGDLSQSSCETPRSRKSSFEGQNVTNVNFDNVYRFD